MPGLFVTFEGIEASGKTTQIAMLEEALTKKGHFVCVTQEPGGTAVGKQIRQLLLEPRETPLIPLAELLLFQANRAQHVFQTIRPALERGQVVLCDRYTDASIAYQGAARGVANEIVESLNQMSTEGLSPDLTFLLDLSPAETQERIANRLREVGHDQARFDMEAPEFHNAVRESYLTIAAREKERFCLIETSGRSIDQLHEEILAKMITKLEEIENT